MANDFQDLYSLDSLEKLSTCDGKPPKKMVRFETEEMESVNFANYIPIMEPTTYSESPFKNTCISCNCVGGFFTEVIPKSNSDFFTVTGASNNTVNHVYVSTNLQNSFKECFFSALNHAAFGLSRIYGIDYTLAIYQKHHKICYKEFTRYTLISVRNLIEILYTRKQVPQSETRLCMCAMFNLVCYRCIQGVLDLHIFTCPKISDLISLQTYYKEKFVTFQGFAQNKFFTARGLLTSNPKQFTSTRMRENPLTVKFSWNVQYLQNKAMNSYIRKDESYCLSCVKPGNGKQPFVCQECLSPVN